MLKNLLDKGKCRLGIHAGEWAFVSPLSCEQQRLCPRCHDRASQVVHSWRAWADDGTGACRFVRSCSRCDIEEAQIDHEWAAARYRDETSCDQVRPCTRCDARDPAPAVHQMDAWEYVGDDRCQQAPRCSRCGVAGAGRRTAHDWDGWVASAFYGTEVCVCRHCGEMVLHPGDAAGDPDASPSFTATLAALWAVMDCDDVSAVREHIVSDSALLLGPVLEPCLAFVSDQQVFDGENRQTLRQLGDLLQRCRSEGTEAVFALPPEPAPVPPPAPAPAIPPPAKAAVTVPAGDRPPGLHGHWRSTEILGAGTGFSMTTDTHLVLDPAGRFSWWSRPDNLEHGTWTASPDRLFLSFEGGAGLSWRYQQHGSGMSFPDDSRYRFWERV